MKRKAAQTEVKRLASQGLRCEVDLFKDSWTVLVSPEWIREESVARPQDGEPTRLWDTEDVDYLLREQEYHQGVPLQERRRRRARRLQELGKTLPEIAFEMKLAESTVRSYLTMKQLKFEMEAA